jgi:hypothetical protein
MTQENTGNDKSWPSQKSIDTGLRQIANVAQIAGHGKTTWTDGIHSTMMGMSQATVNPGFQAHDWQETKTT